MQIRGPFARVRHHKFVEIELIEIIFIFFIASLICLCELFLSVQLMREDLGNLS
jgi:hypothetical protein